MRSVLGTWLATQALSQRRYGACSGQSVVWRRTRRRASSTEAAPFSTRSEASCSMRMTAEEVEELASLVAEVPQQVDTTAMDVAKALAAAQPSAFTAAELQSIVEVLQGSADLKQLRLNELQTTLARVGSSRGLFLVFEGLDRSGKSTQSKLVAEAFESEGAKSQWTSCPDRSTAVGALIDLYLRKRLELPDKVIHELFAANRWEKVPSLLAALSAGVNVVCDRYAFSGVAYSAAKGLDFDWCKSPDVGLPCPDAVFYLHVDPKVGQNRSNYGDERYENVAMQGKVRREFQRHELRDGVLWHDVNGDRAIDAIHEEIWGKVAAVKQRKAALTQLWTVGA